MNISFLQDVGAWIVAPKELIIDLSSDGKSFTTFYDNKGILSIEDLKVQVKNIEATFPAVPARYVRIRAIQYGKLPAWHEGAGGDTHIFVDEINVE